MHQIPGLVPNDQELFVYFDLFFKEIEKYFWSFLARQKQPEMLFTLFEKLIKIHKQFLTAGNKTWNLMHALP